MLQQGLQQGLLAAGKLHDLAVEPGFAAAGVVAQRAMLDAVDGAPGHAPQQRVQAGAQLTQVERLDQVIVSAGLQAGHAIGYRVAGRQYQHRQGVALLAQPLEQLEPVYIR